MFMVVKRKRGRSAKREGGGKDVGEATNAVGERLI